MDKVVEIEATRRRAAERERAELHADARRVIENYGQEAGYFVGLMARLPDLPEVERRSLAELEAAIKRETGMSWVFGDEAGAA